MTGSAWNPAHYLRFGAERTRPASELSARVRVDSPTRVVDLGCGPGNSTQVLRERWPSAHVTGVDSSPQMIAAARDAFPAQSWLVGRIEDWTPDTAVDVVFSNAALQWLGDHAELTARLFQHVSPGGALAFQIPSGRYAGIRGLIHDVADDPAWRDRMHAARSALTMEPAEAYYDALAPRASDVDIWETRYQHVMPSPDAIVDWMASTGLRPFLDALASDAERTTFRARLVAGAADLYPRRADGSVLFPFTRLFVIAYA